MQTSMKDVPEGGKLMEKTRNYGIDLLRCISMIMVVILHVLSRGGVISSVNISSAEYNAACLIEIAAYCAVNCYALISGYVGISSQYKITNIIMLWIQVTFYSALISIGYSLYKWGHIAEIDWMVVFFPMLSNQYWYFTAYFGAFFLIPFFNILVLNLTKKQAKSFVLVIILLFSFIPTLCKRDIFYLSNGYSFLWLSMMYVVGACIRKHDLFASATCIHSIIVYFFSVIFTWGLKLLTEISPAGFIGEIINGTVFVEYTSPTIVLCSIALLLAFSKFDIRSGKKLISFFSLHSFSVYLIHVHPIIWEKFMLGRFAFLGRLPFMILPIAAILTSIGLFVVLSVLDIPRHMIIKKLHMKDCFLSLEKRIHRVL